MKKYKLLMMISIAIYSFTLTGCGKGKTTEVTSKQKYFEATVLSVDTMSLLVEPAEGTDERNSSDQIEISTSNLSEADSILYLNEAAIGDRIQIGYLGDIAETYPARIDEVFEISLIEREETH